ncbi:MAG: amidohydrolase family protein [Sedimentisphaerales bacterium]|nr:amidohydrolase family protein [Sedimentisphaerales bacterium]
MVRNMIVDCHTHIENITGENVANEHLTAVETVDACIVLATSDGPSNEVNKKLSEYVTKYNEKMVGFSVIRPDEDKISTSSLESATLKLGLKGLVLYCSDWGIHPTNSRNMRLYESALELALPVFFHNAGVDIKQNAVLDYAQPYLLDEVAREFPSLKFVIGNMGAPFIEQTLIMVAKHQNVYADLTIKPKNIWQTYNTVIAAYEYNVMDKLLFGSGFPTYNAGQCIETLLGFNMQLADTNLPAVPRVSIKSIIERDTLPILGIKETKSNSPEKDIQKDKQEDTEQKSKKPKKKD